MEEKKSYFPIPLYCALELCTYGYILRSSNVYFCNDAYFLAFNNLKWFIPEQFVKERTEWVPEFKCFFIIIPIDFSITALLKHYYYLMDENRLVLHSATNPYSNCLVKP